MVVNLTQHRATPEQIAQGVQDLPQELRDDLVRLLTIEEIPTASEVASRCEAIAGLIFQTDSENYPTAVMIGGAPWMMGPLVKALRNAGVVQCLAAFSKRVSVESVDTVTGVVTKTSDFVHIGLVECSAQ